MKKVCGLNMDKLNEIELSLAALEGGTFQRLVHKLILEDYNSYDYSITNYGQVIGSFKTRKGRPDIFIKNNKNNRNIAIEVGTDIDCNKKLKADIEHYFKNNKKFFNLDWYENLKYISDISLIDGAIELLDLSYLYGIDTFRTSYQTVIQIFQNYIKYSIELKDVSILTLIINKIRDYIKLEKHENVSYLNSFIDDSINRFVGNFL